MTTLTTPKYAFDPTGQSPANRITGELQALTGNGSAYSFIVPALAPFFGDTLTISLKTLQGEIRALVPGVDFYLSHYFLGASRACGKPIYGSITILNTSLRGTLILNAYQTLGGEWTLDPATITSILANQINNPRTTTWEMVAGYPDIFPPVPHAWNLQDLVGMGAVVQSVNKIIDAILTQASSAMVQHMADHENPHGVTALQIGAVTQQDMSTAIQNAIAGLNLITDSVPEGNTNKYFTDLRAVQAKLVGLQVVSAEAIADGDSIMLAIEKLQALINSLNTAIGKKADSARPQFSGLGSQNLVTYRMTGTMAIDISQAEAFQITIAGNGAIGFNTSAVGNMTGKVVEFAVTTVNDTSGNAYAIAWPANVKWVDGAPPPRTTAAGAKDLWYFVSDDNMVTWTGSLSNSNPR
jgi:hypothetical protein